MDEPRPRAIGEELRYADHELAAGPPEDERINARAAVAVIAATFAATHAVVAVLALQVVAARTAQILSLPLPP